MKILRETPEEIYRLLGKLLKELLLGRILTGNSGVIPKRNPQGSPEGVLEVFRKINFGKVSYPGGTFKAIIGRISARTLCGIRGEKGEIP